MFDEPVEIKYRTTVDERRTGPVGSVLCWLADHPIWGGLICGAGVVAVAGLRRPAGVRAEPVVAGLISLAVVIVWMILFFLMRNFFDAQSYRTRDVVRQLVVDNHQARWLEDDEPLRQLQDPTLRLAANPVPDGIVDESRGTRDATAWPIWIVIEGDDDRLVFETRDAAVRAADYDEITDELIEETDERLPRAIASPLLQVFYGAEGLDESEN